MEQFMSSNAEKDLFLNLIFKDMGRQAVKMDLEQKLFRKSIPYAGMLISENQAQTLKRIENAKG